MNNTSRKYVTSLPEPVAAAETSSVTPLRVPRAPGFTPDETAHRAIVAALKPHERVPYLIGRQLNETLLGKRAGMLWTRLAARPALHQLIKNRLERRGEEHLPPRSCILAVNHRTWFDLYAATISIWPMYEKTPFLYCPVRSNFYYERPLGVLLNLAASGNAMYPPIFRDDRGPALNRLAVDACHRVLDASPRTIIGIHPEGTRNKGDDPYTFLPPKPGIGYIALRSRAPVVPCFVAGLPSDFGTLVKARFRRDAEPVRVWFGPPVDYSDMVDHGETRDNAHAVAQRTMDALEALAHRDHERMRAWHTEHRRAPRVEG